MLSRSSGTSNARSPVKQLVIKNFKVQPSLPENFEENTWLRLRDAVRAVHNKTPVADSLETLYRATEDMCSHKLDANLYRRLRDECELHARAKLTTLKPQSIGSVDFLYVIDECWKDHCEQMHFIRSIFLCLDRKYVIQTTGVKSLWDMGLELFREIIVREPAIAEKLLDGLLILIENERNGEIVDRALLKRLLRMEESLAVYGESFERPFLNASTQYYEREGQEKIESLSVPLYLTHVSTRLAEENSRIETYLAKTSRRDLIVIVERQLLANHTTVIFEKGFDTIMDENRIPDLTLLYRLMSRVSALPQLRSCWNDYIKKRGTELVIHESKDATMVQDLLDFKARLTIVLHGPFQSNDDLTYSMKEAFETFINRRPNKPAEMIAKFLDKKLRAGGKSESEDDLEALLDKVMEIFRFIQGGDVFEAFYKKDLAKRLLLNKSASIDMEKLMIQKLKEECGSTFTGKLEGMFKDIELSKDIMVSFKNSKASQELGNEVDLNVYVLTTGFWPPYTPTEVNLPDEMARYQEVFKNFYLSKYKGRRLLFQNSLGHCVVKAYFAKGPKELCVSLFQAVILSLFNASDSIPFRDIKQRTGIEDKELRRTLQSLACGKLYKLLLKEPKGRDVNDDDVFHFNARFVAKLFRLKINSIQIKETPEEQKKTEETVFKDRQYQIDAAIVRIMKARKTLNHQLLLSELFQQLKFQVKPAQLKKRIESLIEREYLERDTAQPSIYHYLA